MRACSGLRRNNGAKPDPVLIGLQTTHNKDNGKK